MKKDKDREWISIAVSKASGLKSDLEKLAAKEDRSLSTFCRLKLAELLKPKKGV